MRFFILFFALLTALNSRAQKNFRPELLKIEWETIENFHKGKNDFLGAYTITNLNSDPFPATGWSIFFNFPRRFKEFKGGVKVEQVNGDFFRMFPTTEFTGLKNGESKRFELVGGAWATNLTDIPAGVYLVWDHDRNKGIPLTNFSVRPSTSSAQLKRYATDNIPQMTPELVYWNNHTVTDLDAGTLSKIFPTPSEYAETAGSFLMNKTDIGFDPAFQQEAAYLSAELSALGIANPALSRGKTNSQISLVKNGLPDEAYDLTVNEKGIKISAGSRSGIFYGIQSLKSLISPQYWKDKKGEIEIPFVSVSDTPRFPHRAFMLDVARNFQSKQQIFKTLDLMALYKLNVFHFHFNDDEGWRLEIPGLPELTEVGGRRGHGWKDSAWLHPSYGSGPSLTSHGSGYFSAAMPGSSFPSKYSSMAPPPVET